MKKSFIVAGILSGLACLLAGSVFLAPMPIVARVNMSQVLFITFFSAGAAVVFLMALKNFTPLLKRAWWFVCGSLFLLVIGSLQWLVIGAMNAFNSPWVTYRGADSLFIAMIVLAYIGIRKFAYLAGVRSIFMNAWAVFGAALLLAGAASLLPSPRTDSPPELISLTVAVWVFQLCIVVPTAVLINKLRRETGRLYQPAQRWLIAYYALIAVACLVYVAMQLMLPSTHVLYQYSANIFLYVVASPIIMLYALKFASIGQVERNVTAVNAAQTAGQPKDWLRSIDVVVFLADLVSTPKAIDTTLDKMREVTATMGGQANLTEAQQEVMAGVYLEIENYLTTAEPIRHYDRNVLRQLVEIRFKSSVNEPRFWQMAGWDQPTPQVTPTQAPLTA